MRINIKKRGLMRFVQRTLFLGIHVAFSLCLFMGSAQLVVAQEQEPKQSFVSATVAVINEVFRQMDGVMSYTAQAIDAVFSNTVRTNVQPESLVDISIPDPLPITSARFPLGGVGLGTLIINAPLSVTNTLTATGESFLATTTVAGLLSADELSLQALSVSGIISAGTLQGGQLSVQGDTQLNTVSASAATLADLSVSGNTSLTNLTVSDVALVNSLLIEGTSQVTGLLSANGGINTNGADVNLGDGSIFASNIVNEVIAGTGVSITGTTSAPVISVDLDGVVTEVNGETGEVNIRAGSDISVSSLRITNTSDLASVRGRGGCSDCITDTDVANTLTLTGGSIDGVTIGSNSVASAFFSDIQVGTSTATTANFAVLGSGTANFGGGINLDTGCFSIGGICVASAASSTSYIGLFDTPGSLLAGSVQYVNASGTALTQSANFVFDGTSLAVGTTSPVTTLTVEGDTTLIGALAVTGTTTIDGALTTTADAAIGGSFTAAASSSFADTLTVGSFVTLQSDLSVVGTSTIGGGLVVSGATTLSDQITINGTVSVQNGASVRLYDADSSNYVAFTASTSLVGNTTWVLPGADGNPDEVMVTDGSGNIRFEPVSAIGGGVTEYVNLIDTPATYTPGAIHYVNASGTALTESPGLSYDGSSLNVGVATTSATLTVDGSVNFVSANGSVGFTFDDASRLVGIGTENPADKLSVQNGSFSQIGGSSGSNYTPVSAGIESLGDATRAIEIAGAYAYVGSGTTGDEFHVVDVTDIAQPIEVGSTNLPANANGIQVSGKYAYVVSGFSGDDFHVIDVSNPTVPLEIESIPLAAAANGVAVKGGYAYVVTDGATSNFQVIDISNPFSVVSVASTSLPTNARSVAVVGNYAYVTTEVSGDDFHTIDISVPTNPTVADSVNLPDTANAVAVSRSGAYTYVGTSAAGTDLHVIDTSDPTNISTVTNIELGVSVTGMALVGEMLYVTSLTAGQDLQVLDLSNPSAPVLIGGVDLGSGNTTDVAVIGKYAYVTTAAGINVVDISGAKTQSILTQSLQAGNMFVSGETNLGNKLAVQGTLFAGADIESVGVLKVFGGGSSYVAGGFSVGTTSSSTGLLVAGSVVSTDLLGGATNLTTDANGNIIRDPSDVRLKTNIVTVENALQSLLQLRGVRYSWRDAERFGAQTEIGFIAQEVDLILPEVVRKGGDYWSINTRNILAVVVEAVKEVWGELQGTQGEVADLQARVNQLESKIDGTAVDTETGTVPDASTTDTQSEVVVDDSSSEDTSDQSGSSEEDTVVDADSALADPVASTTAAVVAEDASASTTEAVTVENTASSTTQATPEETAQESNDAPATDGSTATSTEGPVPTPVTQDATSEASPTVPAATPDVPATEADALAEPAVPETVAEAVEPAV